MRIGIDARLWNETGVGRYIRSLVYEMGKIKNPHTYIIFLRRSDYETTTLPSPQFEKVLADTSWHTLEEQIMMPQSYRNANIDLLHVPYFSVPLFSPRPFVVTLHDLTISHFATGMATTKPFPLYQIKRWGYKLVLSSAVKRASSIITVSETIKKQILEEYKINPGKIFVTYESGKLEETVNESQIAPVTYAYILYVGNAHPHKNLEVLIQAFPQVLTKVPNLKLVLIGKRDFFYERLIGYVKNKKLEANIEFPGEIENVDLPNWYKHASAFIFPSLSEGFGIPGLEAMSLTCPVIAADTTIFHEIYGDAALYFDPGNSVHLAKTILNILSDTKLKSQLIDKGKRKTAEYSWHKMARETLTIYENSARI